MANSSGTSVQGADKNQAVIDFLMTCPYVQAHPMFFNFINAKDDNKQFLTTTNDKAVNRPFIDGSVLKRYTFTIVDYKSIAYNALVTIAGYPDENVEDMFQVQSLIDWITEQADAHNYPDFGENCIIDDMKALSENPSLNGIDTSVKPTLAKYSVSIQIDYLDTSKKIM